MSDDFEQLAKAAFAEESVQMLELFERAVLRLRHEALNTDTVRDVADAAFRAVHTIKGSAGIFAMEPLVRLAHSAESLLAEVRDERLDASPAVEAALLSAHDLMRQLCAPVPGSVPATPDRLVAEIERLVATRQTAESDSGVMVLSWRPTNAVEHDNDAVDSLALALESLQALGEMIGVPGDDRSADSQQPWDAGFDALFRPRSAPESIEPTLSALRQLGDLRTLSIDAGANEWSALLQDRTSSEAMRSSLLKRWDSLGLNATARLGSPENRVSQSASVPGAMPEAQPRPLATGGGPRLRVGAAKVDSLIDSLSAAASTMALSHQAALRSKNAGIAESTELAQQAVKQARLEALELRMTSVAEVFGRFPRLVRDVSQALGKEVELIIDDGDAEIDRAIVEAVTDPLTHLIRNSLDHGIEPASERVRAGKPAKGHLVLSAKRASGHVVLELRDDGRGLDHDRIRARAAELGLAAANARLTDTDLLNLICSPGFSTASQVTDLSGRGVGMDVVKRNVEALHGHLSMTSVPGRGTVFELRVPMTLALLAGLVVRVGALPYVIPLDVVSECAEVPAIEIGAGATDTVQVQGLFVPCVDLRQLFAATAPAGRRKRAAGVLVPSQGRQLAVIVDAIAGEQQVVIRSLGPALARLAVFNGATVLDDGTVGHILDVDALQAQLSADPPAQPQAA